MKNIKTYLSVFAFAAMCVVGYSTYADITMSETDKMMLINIEALTTTEVNLPGQLPIRKYLGTSEYICCEPHALDNYCPWLPCSDH